MSEYIMDLRKLLGNRPLMQAGASVMVVDSQDRVLREKRRDNGLWAYAGGAVELYESVEDAARRELLEETGLIAEKMTLFGLFSGPEMAYTYPNGDRVSNLDAVYLCREYHGELRPQPDEVTELRFFAREELPNEEELMPPNRPALKKWRQDGFDYKAYWRAVLAQDASAMEPFFWPEALIDWPNTNERFTWRAFIRANCEYPGRWEGEILRAEFLKDRLVTVVAVRGREGGPALHAASFFTLRQGRILHLEEYWGDDGPAPRWRQVMAIGQPLHPEK